MVDDPGEQGWGEAAASADACEDEAVDEAALLRGHPAGDELVGGWIDDRLAGTEGEADGDEENNGVGDARR